jgi:cell division septum initiation protein DivIVA
VEAEELIAQLRTMVESARSMPMSASAVINRTEMLDLLARLERAVVSALGDRDGDGVSAERDGVVAGAHEQAADVLAAAERERADLVGETGVFRLAKQEADAERARAAAEAEELRRETEDYVDSRLATFEVTLTKTLEAVTRGRARLHGRSHFDALGVTARGADEPDPDGGSGRLTTPDELKPDAAEQAG